MPQFYTVLLKINLMHGNLKALSCHRLKNSRIPSSWGPPQNCLCPELTYRIVFWSIRLLKRWVKEFSVQGSDSQYTWHSLPFGWKYSPLICQTLVSSVVHTSIWHLC